MQRLTKFRAWDKIANKMYSPKSFKRRHYGLNYQTDSVELSFSGMEHAEQVLLMQYTGLKDKNDVEIYEGDIIKLEERVLSDNCETSTPHIETKRDDHFVYADKTVGLRVWGHEVICIDDKFGTHNDDWTDYFGYESPSAIQRGEVIGNIYENSELLEDTQ